MTKSHPHKVKKRSESPSAPRSRGFSLDEATNREIDRLAEHMRASRTQVVRDAVRQLAARTFDARPD